MISFNNLMQSVNSTSGDFSSAQTAQGLNSDAFREKLAGALAAIIDDQSVGDTSTESHVEISIDQKQQKLTISVVPSTVTAGGTSSATYDAADVARYGSAVAFMQKYSATQSAPVLAASPEIAPEPTDAFDSYWAQQPEAVQKLRTMMDITEREFEANRLAEAGYQVDGLIMVWGWNPVTAMKMRHDYGYTWVPAWGQPPVRVQPGIQFGNEPVYDPASPPPGSIPVSLEFAKGKRLDPLYFSDPAALAAEIDALTPATSPT